MSTLCYRGKSVDIELNFHVDLLNFDLNNYTRVILNNIFFFKNNYT